MKSISGQENDEDEVDRILARKDEILPSSGFADAVMESVRQEAAAPQPIAFPWKRALPGLLVGAVALVVGLVAGVTVIVKAASGSIAPQAATATLPALPSLFHGGIESAVIWTMLSLLMAFVSVKLSTRAT